MKRILLSAIAAVCIGALTSCVNEIDDNINDIRKENYTKAFVQEFGVIDPTHDWGFSSSGYAAPASRDGEEGSNVNDPDWLTYVKSKDIDVNAENWKNPPLVKDWERLAVINYLHDHPGPGTKSFPQDKPFFMTHVGTCHDLANESNGLFQHGEYTALDGNNRVIGHERMDNLHVGLTEGCTLAEINSDTYTPWDPDKKTANWAHVNNFNAGNNANYGGNTVVSGHGNGGGYDFAYYNSVSSKYYNNYKVVAGGDIDYRLSAYYYLCFDFEAYKMIKKTKFTVVYNTNQTTTVEVNGFYRNGEGVTKSDIATSLGVAEADVVSFNFLGYDDNSKLIEADGIYDDWVIRICCDAVHKQDDRIPIYPHEDYNSFRIFVEDLAVLSNNSFTPESTDWDFNDLVYDVTYIEPKSGEDEGKIRIVLRALGGTLPVYFYGADNEPIDEELHMKFGVSSSTMVNTGKGAVNGLPLVTLDYKPSDFDINVNNKETVIVKVHGANSTVTRIKPVEYNKIKVYVEVDGKRTEMHAEKGEAPSKLCVPSYLAAPEERVMITDPYPKFYDYVNNKDVDFWETAVGVKIETQKQN